jgi:NADPH:quinone reductase-like Zn-dependent oxidoreductase
MSRVVQFSKTGTADVLQIVDAAIPEPKAAEVRIRVKALGLNRAESMFRSGAYIEDPDLPARLGYEAAGTVESVGPSVTEFKVGDRVSVIPSFSMNEYAMYGELVVAPEHAVVKHPAALSFEEAASIWMMFVTAYDGLIGTAKIEPGDVVLITAASSSVGLAAIQIANLIGAKPIALTRTAEKKDLLLKAGAWHVIATEEEDLVAQVNKITNGHGANVVYDPVGGPTFTKLIAAAARGARVIVYGALSPDVTPLPMLEMIAKNLTVRGAIIANTSGDAKLRKAAIEFVTGGLQSGALKPVIDKQFSLNQIVDAHKYLEGNQQFGKIVVTV